MNAFFLVGTARCLSRIIGFLAFVVAMSAALSAAAVQRTPVIIDTDIGDDFDDCWALAMALKMPQLDLKLITTCYGQSEYRAKLIDRLVTATGRTDLPIGLGSAADRGTGEQLQAWLGDVTLATYAGGIRRDGPQAMVDAINQSSQTITVIALGPMDTLAAALKIDPRIAAKANLVGMFGSVRVGYGQKPGAVVEYNVKCDTASAQVVLSAPWKSITFTPLDTAGGVFLDERRFLRLSASEDRTLATLRSSYGAFIASFLAQHGSDLLKKYGYPPPDRITFSNPIYDAVGVYLADPDCAQTLNFETLTIKVTNQGLTAIDPAGRPMQVASSWKDKNRFLEQVVTILGGKPAAEADR